MLVDPQIAVSDTSSVARGTVFQAVVDDAVAVCLCVGREGEPAHRACLVLSGTPNSKDGPYGITFDRIVKPNVIQFPEARFVTDPGSANFIDFLETAGRGQVILSEGRAFIVFLGYHGMLFADVATGDMVPIPRTGIVVGRWSIYHRIAGEPVDILRYPLER